MADAQIQCAPGDRHTVIVLGGNAEREITKRLMRAGGVTQLDPEATEYEPFKFRPSSGTTKPHPWSKPRHQRRTMSWQPPPPPPGVRSAQVRDASNASYTSPAIEIKDD